MKENTFPQRSRACFLQSLLLLQLFCLVILFYGLFSLAAKEEGRYTGPISLQEKRLNPAKKEFENTKDFPTEWTLFFKEKKGNYAVFYDWNGSEAHFQYKRNKFDEDGEAFVSQLFPGNAYLVKGELKGVLIFPKDQRGKRKALPDRKNWPPNPEEFSDPNTIPIFQLKEYKEVFSKQILH